MAYTLYYSPGTASLAAHWMLLELGVPFELALTDIEAGAQKSADYLKLNPAGRVPTLIVDGAPRTEIAALLMLLAEREGDGRFDVPAGSADRAAYLQTMLWLANTLQPAFRAWFYADEVAGPDNAEAAKAAARASIETGLSRLDAHLADGRPFMVGGGMTAADFLAAMLTRWSRNMPRPATDWPHLGAYVDRMRAMPSLREVHRREGLADWIGG